MSNECITIESSDEDDVQSSTNDRLQPQLILIEKSANVVNEKNDSNTKSANRRTTLQLVTGESVFNKFLAKCKEADPSNDMDLIVNKLLKRFHEADSAFTSSLFFIHLVEKLMDGVPAEPYSQMKTISDELKYRTIKIKKHQEVEKTKKLPPKFSMEDGVTLKRAKKIKKLEKLIESIHRKIALLESQEIDFNDSDDENSAYIRVSRYKDRICQVFKKICELRNTASTEYALRSNIKFTGTRLPVVNKAIEKFYNDKKEFPDFRDVLCVVEKVNEIKRLNLSPKDCQQIAEQAFRELGETLKQQRQYDFYDTISCYLNERREDPAAADPSLKQKLEQNKKQFGNRIDEVIDKYAQMQYDENLQPDTVTSDAASEDEDDDECDDSILSLSEPDEELKKECNDVSSPPVLRDFQIRLINVTALPEWEKYDCAQKLRVSSIPLESLAKEGQNNRHCKNECEPIAGSSKDFISDLCPAHSLNETYNHNRKCLKRSTSVENEYRSKKVKLNETTLTENDAGEIVKKQKTIATSDDVEKNDLILLENEVVEQSFTWRIEDVRTEKDFHGVKSSGNAAEISENNKKELCSGMFSRNLTKTSEENDVNLKTKIEDITCGPNSNGLHEELPGEEQKKLCREDASSNIEKKGICEERKAVVVTDNKSDVGGPKLNSNEEAKLVTIVKNKSRENNEKKMNSYEKEQRETIKRDKFNIGEKKKLDSNEKEKLKIIEKNKSSDDGQEKLNFCEEKRKKAEKASEVCEGKNSNFKEEGSSEIVEEKKSDSNEEVKLKITVQNPSPVNKIQTSKVNERRKGDKKLNDTTKQQTEIIDLEKLPDTLKKPSGSPDITTFIKNMNFKCHPTVSSMRITSDSCNRMSFPVTSANSRSLSTISTSSQVRYPITSTPKTRPNTNVRSTINPTAVIRNFNSNPLKRVLPVPSRPLNAIDIRKRMCNQESTSSRTFRSSFAKTAMAKRTMQTTERKILHNNVITRTTTVVEESMMQIRPNNGRVPAGLNSQTYVQSQRFSQMQQTQQNQKNSGQSFTKRFTADDVITLD